MLKGTSAWKIVRIFSLNYNIVVIFVFSDNEETSLGEFRWLTLTKIALWVSIVLQIQEKLKKNEKKNFSKLNRISALKK